MNGVSTPFLRLPPSHAESPRARSRPVGDGIEGVRGGWSFGGGLPLVFERHARRSIPGYEELHDICAAQVRSHPSPRRILDLGCSTGALTRKLKRTSEGALVIGVDREPAMVAEASRKDPGGTYLCSDLDRFEFGASDAVFALYVIQFMPPATRAPLLARVRAGLNPGGFFIFAEKVKAQTPGSEAEQREEYHAFKRAQGFSPQEIRAKEESLEGILVPLTERDNEALLAGAGFREVTTVFSELCFRAWLARP